MSRGRPTTYSPALCSVAGAHLRAGGSLTSLAADLGVTRMRLHCWRRTHPDFDSACAIRPAPLPSPPVTAAPTTAVVFSLAAWGVPLRPIAADGIEPTLLTEDDVDDMLARAA